MAIYASFMVLSAIAMFVAYKKDATREAGDKSQ
jgi:hypothetical protein